MMPPQPNYPPAPVMPPPARVITWPTPEARIVPRAWTITLVALTALSLLLALSSALTVTPAPTAPGTPVYASSLAQADGAWQFPAGHGACAFANGGLDATSTAAGHLAPACVLKQMIPGNLRISARLVPQAQLSGALRAAIVVHGTVAFLFDSSGTIQVLQYDPDTQNYHRIFASVSIQWHADGVESNLVVIQANSGLYTVALNGAQVYQGSIATALGRSDTGDVALGSYTPQNPGTNATSEAEYTDVSIVTL